VRVIFFPSLAFLLFHFFYTFYRKHFFSGIKFFSETNFTVFWKNFRSIFYFRFFGTEEFTRALHRDKFFFRTEEFTRALHRDKFFFEQRNLHGRYTETNFFFEQRNLHGRYTETNFFFEQRNLHGRYTGANMSSDLTPRPISKVHFLKFALYILLKTNKRSDDEW
jgi:hypothetical protein